jgi:hypothetical protein
VVPIDDNRQKSPEILSQSWINDRRSYWAVQAIANLLWCGQIKGERRRNQVGRCLWYEACYKNNIENAKKVFDGRARSHTILTVANNAAKQPDVAL